MSSYMGGVSKLEGVSRDELACIYAALILADDDIAVTSEKISAILHAAEVRVENIWPQLYAKALSTVNITDVITGAVMSGATGGGVPATATTEECVKQEEQKPAAPQEDEEDSDDDFGLSLFD